MEISETTVCEGIALQSSWCKDAPLYGNEKDAYRMFLCRQDCVAVVLNHKRYELEGGCLLICFPGDALEVVRYGDTFAGCYMSVSRCVMERLFQFSSQSWKASSHIREMPLIPLEDNNISILLSYFHLMDTRSCHSVLRTDPAGMYDLVSTFVRDCVNIAAKRRQCKGSASMSAANVLFNKFVHLIHSDAPQKKGVEYYADKLCVSSKYLSTVCKHVSGNGLFHIEQMYDQ